MARTAMDSSRTNLRPADFSHSPAPSKYDDHHHERWTPPARCATMDRQRNSWEAIMGATAPQFMFDFGSPNAFLSHKAIPAIESRIGTKFEYVPILLGGVFKATNNRSPAETLAGIKNKREFQAIETSRFLKRFQVQPYTWNPFFPVNTLNLMRAAVAAQLDGVFETYVEAAFHHMWVEPKKMDDPVIALEALTASGLDARRLFARAAEADVKAKLIENTQIAVDRGAFGSPTFFVGNEIFFGKEQLRDVEEMVLGK
jgi:2-hydroxychromene-2-carboxylate isomerase